MPLQYRRFGLIFWIDLRWKKMLVENDIRPKLPSRPAVDPSFAAIPLRISAIRSFNVPLSPNAATFAPRRHPFLLLTFTQGSPDAHPNRTQQVRVPFIIQNQKGAFLIFNL